MGFMLDLRDAALESSSDVDEKDSERELGEGDGDKDGKAEMDGEKDGKGETEREQEGEPGSSAYHGSQDKID